MPMRADSSSQLLAAFEACRPDLIALAYRMLGDLARAQDIVQDAWLRWQAHEDEVHSARAFLITVVTRLCLNELGSARARREESRSDRLPEPVDLGESGLSNLERLDQISMAFLVVLQRLSPAERAVLLLHDVFDFDHARIGELVGHTAAACRKLLERARKSLARERRLLSPRSEEHSRLLQAFVRATSDGDTQTIVSMLARDATMITDGGPTGRALGRVRNLPRPLQGAERIAAFVVTTNRRAGGELSPEYRELNGQPAVVFWVDAQPFAALLLGVANGKIQHVYFHADLARLRHVGRRGTTRHSA